MVNNAIEQGVPPRIKKTVTLPCDIVFIVQTFPSQ